MIYFAKDRNSTISFSPRKTKALTSVYAFSDEDEEAGDQIGLAAQTRGLHQHDPLRERHAGTIGGG